MYTACGGQVREIRVSPVSGEKKKGSRDYTSEWECPGPIR